MNEDILKRDAEHLKLLTVFHYIVAAIIIFFSSFFIIHIVFGVFCFISPEKMVDSQGNQPPAFMCWLFTILGLAFVVLGWIFSICVFSAARFLAQRRKYLFCFIVACISCLFAPFGTALGVFTIIVLIRPSVKELFKV